MIPPLTVLLDFDGTLTQQDMGELLLDTFASREWRKEAEAWRSDAITFKELNEREFSHLPSGKQREMVQFALERATLRPGALALVRFCELKGIPLEIVSGGLDFYIHPLLRKFGIEHIPLSSFKAADFSQGERVVPTYPPGVVVCDISGVCKCSRVWRYQEKGYRVVYLGDGNSDRCVAGKADVVYARRLLARYCQEQGIVYTPFETMDEVVAGLKSLLGE